jgi:hypothetical protein
MDEIEKVFSVRQESDPALVGNEGAADDPHRSADGAEAGYRVQGPGMGLLSGSGRGPRTT